MGLYGFYNLSGIEIENSYIHITRFQVATQYISLGEHTYSKYMVMDYDFALFKDKATSVAEPNSPIKKFQRNRITYQLIDGGSDDVWQIIYDDIRKNISFRDFIEDEE